MKNLCQLYFFVFATGFVCWYTTLYAVLFRQSHDSTLLSRLWCFGWSDAGGVGGGWGGIAILDTLHASSASWCRSMENAYDVHHSTFPVLVIEISSWRVATELHEINLSRPPSHWRIWPLPKPSTLKRRSQPWSSPVLKAVPRMLMMSSPNETWKSHMPTASKIVKTCSWTVLRAIHRSSTIVSWIEKSHQISQQRQRQAFWSPNESWCWCCVVRDDCGRCSQLFGVFRQ